MPDDPKIDGGKEFRDLLGKLSRVSKTEADRLAERVKKKKAMKPKRKPKR